jgi:hypothetical protein
MARPAYARRATAQPRLGTWLDEAASRLAATNRAFTRKNLYHAVRRAGWSTGELHNPSFEAFCDGPLASRLREGALPGLLPLPVPAPARRLPREWDAYFPAAILVVDRPAIVDLFVASGALVQARIAPVALDGTPAHVIRWLCRGFMRGHRAPIAYLHDAATVVYPFTYEPIATLIDVTHGEPLPYCDLGLPTGGVPASAFPFTAEISADERILELEQLPPAALVAYASRRALALVPPDPLLAPLVRSPSGRNKR